MPRKTGSHGIAAACSDVVAASDAVADINDRSTFA
jgi:hypothetical protein